MAELADAQDLGSCEAIRVGSTPTTRTTSERTSYRSLRPFVKGQSSFIPSLLLSKCDSLRRGRILFFGKRRFKRLLKREEDAPTGRPLFFAYNEGVERARR